MGYIKFFTGEIKPPKVIFIAMAALGFVLVSYGFVLLYLTYLVITR